MDNIVVNKGTFVIYGSQGCSNCETVKKLLNDKNKPFVYKLFGLDYELEELMEILPAPSRSMPQVFHVGEGNVLEYIGALMETVKWLKEN